MKTVLILGALLLAGCGERASTFDPERGRFVDTQEYRRDEIRRQIARDRVHRERD